MITQSTVLLMVCIGALILILALLILFHENATATKGYQLRSLQRERIMLLLEQEVLNMEIAESQALQHLQEDAQILGMIPVLHPSYARALPSNSSSSSSSNTSSLSSPSSAASTGSGDTTKLDRVDGEVSSESVRNEDDVVTTTKE